MSHISKKISLMEGHCVNLMAHGCTCVNVDEMQIRKRLDDVYAKWVDKIRAERNKPV